MQATSLLGIVLGESVGKVTGAIYRSAKNATGKAIVGSGKFVVNRSLRTWKATRSGGITAAATGKRMVTAVAERVKSIWHFNIRKKSSS